MKIIDCAADSGMAEITVRRWIKQGKLSVKKQGLRNLFIEPEVWEKFCTDNNIKRKGDTEK